MKHSMARDSGQPKNTELTAFLEDGSELEGHLTFRGIVRINGHFKGTIVSTDGLIIGQTAKIIGTIKVGSINIGGSIEGEIQAAERIEIQASGHVKGTLAAPAIVVHEGAQIDGDLRILRANEKALVDQHTAQQKKQAVG